MKLPLAVLALIASAGLVLPSTGCTRSASKQASVSRVKPLETYGLLRNEFAVLVDVREKAELARGMAEPARWFPTSKIEDSPAEWKAFVATLPKDKQIIFYCAGGGRSQDAAEKVAAEGYKAANMGGYADWVKAGLPVKKPE
jgi:rhodanese-related sulfurtransferase